MTSWHQKELLESNAKRCVQLMDVLIKSNKEEYAIVMGQTPNYAAVKDEHGKEKRIMHWTWGKG
eukprot:scaffold7744_cov76-Skeletonema_dohrnii-CCMP3373.AAC.5